MDFRSPWFWTAWLPLAIIIWGLVIFGFLVLFQVATGFIVASRKVQAQKRAPEPEETERRQVL